MNNKLKTTLILILAPATVLLFCMALLLCWMNMSQVFMAIARGLTYYV